jgi:sec-independent protein translocase protein TatB
MFDIGWTELMVIGVVALIVIGPKDLPEMFRTLGRFTTKARGMAREFQRAMETAADESGVKDVAKDLKTMTSAKNLGLDAVKNAANKFAAWDPLKSNPTLPKGPATQALADAQAAKKADAASILAPAPVPMAATAPEPAAEMAPVVQVPDKSVPKRAAKPKAAGTAPGKSATGKLAKAADASAAPKKPARKPAAKKGDA